VLALGSHLLGDDLSLLAWQRDDHRGTPAPDGLDEDGFIGWLDALQAEWVHASRRLSPRLVIELLDWTGPHVVEVISIQDPSTLTGDVSWASSRPVPAWLDHARELTERWIHRQQILEAVGLPSDLQHDLLVPVLDGLRWSYPYRLDSHKRPAGATVEIAVAGVDLELRWHLVSDDETWNFEPPADGPPAATLHMTSEQAWRLLSNNFSPDRHGEVLVSGDPTIVSTLTSTRGIIGTPKQAAS